ncbi:MAG: protein TolR [Alphaproteobacteria bacterium]|nr:MAG: protein TolR [Alphaproteobacteria bacterium]
MHEINVTPLVDVMLVLLIVFMITAPLLTVGVAVDLPKTQARAMSEDQEPLTITIQADGTVYLQEEVIEVGELAQKLMAIVENGYDERIFVRGDRNVNYGRIMAVMGTINAAGFRRVALITDPEQQY